MKIVIPDDYQDAVRSLDCFSTLAEHQVTVYHDSVKDPEVLAKRFRDADALVLNSRAHSHHRATSCPPTRLTAYRTDRQRSASH